MSMSKRDYQLIADAIRTSTLSQKNKEVIALTIGRAIDSKGGNDRFDVHGFLAASTYIDNTAEEMTK